MFYEKSAKHGLDVKEHKLKKDGKNVCDPRGQKVRGGVADDPAVC